MILIISATLFEGEIEIQNDIENSINDGMADKI